mgnify:CR=1 FL=1
MVDISKGELRVCAPSFIPAYIKHAHMIGSLSNPYILVPAGDDAAANLVASLVDFADIPLAYLTV